CAPCHGANGRGSWRATIFLIRPGNLRDRKAVAPLSDDYMFNLIKHGGATIRRPGMPAFGYHLSDDEIRALVAYVRTLSAAPRARSLPSSRGAPDDPPPPPHPP